MQSRDFGRGSDSLAIQQPHAVADHMGYRTEWQIDKFDSGDYTFKAKSLFDKAAEFIILAQYFLLRGLTEKVTEYKRQADELIHRANEFAFSRVAIDGNLLLNEGINNFITIGCGGAGTAYNNANARLGVGDSSTAEAATQTDLQAATNKLYKAMDASYPTYGTSQQMVFKSTFASADANYTWNEFTVDNGAAASLNLNRKVSAQGTKASGQSWALTLTITLS